MERYIYSIKMNIINFIFCTMFCCMEYIFMIYINILGSDSPPRTAHRIEYFIFLIVNVAFFYPWQLNID